MPSARLIPQERKPIDLPDSPIIERPGVRGQLCHHAGLLLRPIAREASKLACEGMHVKNQSASSIPVTSSIFFVVSLTIIWYAPFGGVTAIRCLVIPCFRPSSTTRVISSLGASPGPWSSNDIHRPSTPNAMNRSNMAMTASCLDRSTPQFTVP